jgi:hypothetical protein
MIDVKFKESQFDTNSHSFVHWLTFELQNCEVIVITIKGKFIIESCYGKLFCLKCLMVRLPIKQNACLLLYFYCQNL